MTGWRFEPLDRSSGVPLHRQIRERLAAAIERSRDARAFPSDRELSAVFGVSRLTVRQAVDALVRDGVLYRVQGKGTFVRNAGLAERVTATTFLQPWLSGRRGYRLVVDELTRARAEEQEVASWLECARGTEVVRVRRSRFVEGARVAIDIRFLPFDLACSLTSADVAGGPLSGYLQKRVGVQVARGHMAVLSRPADAGEARLLGLRPGDPVLVRRLQLRSSTERVLLAGWSIYRPDQTVLEFTISG
ncbi:MAG TPA: GntR family transcriptional regulator [Candidatus Dormibacteraeota bacterium]|nr:GntR family transcriptional regulator [Candidatus Dormibacteraeota bacterium]